MRKRILEVITRSDWAGGQKVLYALVRGIKEFHSDEFEVEVACGKENGMLVPELEKIGVKVHLVEDLVREVSPVRDLKAFFQLRRLIKKGNYDVVHLHSSKAGFLGRIAARLCGVKSVVYTVHGWWSIEQYQGLKRKLFILAERFAARFCDKIVLLCERDLGRAKSWKIGKENQYVVIPNAIVPLEEVQKGKLRRELGVSEGVKIVGNVARLAPQKNPLRFFEVAKMVLEKRKDILFVWIGGSVVNDAYGRQVEEWLAKNEGVASFIRLLPFRKDAIELMADFDVFLLTSDSEGMPLVVLEALSLGIPVVSTDVGCVEEMPGRVFVGRSQEELCEHVLALLDGDSQAEEARPPTLSYEAFVEKYVRLFREGLGLRSA